MFIKAAKVSFTSTVRFRYLGAHRCQKMGEMADQVFIWEGSPKTSRVIVASCCCLESQVGFVVDTCENYTLVSLPQRDRWQR